MFLLAAILQHCKLNKIISKQTFPQRYIKNMLISTKTTDYLEIT